MARGDKAAVEEELGQFVQGRYLALRRTAYLLCGDWHRAEDLVQGTLVKVVVAARRRRVDSLDAYSRQVLLRLFLEENKRLWRRRGKRVGGPGREGRTAVARARNGRGTRMTTATGLRRPPASTRRAVAAP